MIAIFWIDRKPRCELTHDGRPLIERPTGWGEDTPVFRQLFSSLFLPGGTQEQLCSATTQGHLS